MSRRIVLSDKEIVSQPFWDGLAALDFVKKDGLWAPPNDIATGSVAVTQNEPEPLDLVLRIELLRPNGSLIHRFGINLRSSMAWYSQSALTDVRLLNGQRLVAYDVAARFES